MILAPMVALPACNGRPFSFPPPNNPLPILRNAAIQPLKIRERYLHDQTTRIRSA
jgi:hypothetical protein